MRLAVFVTARFERGYRALLKSHRALATEYATVIGILQADPYNRTHAHAIRKLEQVEAGDGQFRIRSGRFRFRFDIGVSVVLSQLSLTASALSPTVCSAPASPERAGTSKCGLLKQPGDEDVCVG